MLIFVLRKVTLRSHINSVPWMYAVTPTPYNECTEFSKRIFWTNCVYIHGTELVWPRKVTLRSWRDRVHSRYGVDSIPQSHSKWFLCTLYTLLWHSFGGFYVSFVHSTELSARLFLQSSESGPPSTAGECVPPSFGSGGGGAYSPACEGVTLRSWCDRVKWPYGVKKSAWSDFDQSKWL